MLRLISFSVAAAAVCALAAGCGRDDPPAAEPAEPHSPAVVDVGGAAGARTFELETVAEGLVRPTFVSGAPGDPAAVWILEQTGVLTRLSGEGSQRVIDVRDAVTVGAEQGLLGLAFHPEFARNGRLFLNYTDSRGDTRVVERRVEPGTWADTGREHVLLRVRQPEENHNGGGLAFGPDARLHVGMGDGGGAWDPRDAAQAPRSRLGKLLAADVDEPGEPRWQTVATGLRNPWRFWFDPALDEVWIADVGQDAFEEVSRVRIERDEPPKNLGWPAFEGQQRMEGRRLRGRGELVEPVAVYAHEHGCSVTGGLIYRGTEIPDLVGRYVFGDFCSGTLWTLRPEPGRRVAEARREDASAPQLTHIGTDAEGELVMATNDGRILRAVPAGRR
jgi:glucose/arabinose dehydrogenase